MLSGRTSTATPKTAPVPRARRHEVVRHDNDQATRASAICTCSLARTGAHSTNVGMSATSATLATSTRRPRPSWCANHAVSGIAAVDTATFEQAEPAVGVPHEDPEAEERGVPRRAERGRHPAAGVLAAVHEPLGDAAVPEEVRHRLRVRDPPPRDAQGEADDHDDQQRPPDVGDLPRRLASRSCLTGPTRGATSFARRRFRRPSAAPLADEQELRHVRVGEGEGGVGRHHDR